VPNAKQTGLTTFSRFFFVHLIYSFLDDLYACRGIIIGRRRDRAKASAACCETVSVLIMLPIDMKNLEVEEH
jgi:hypothetical protein